MQTVIEISREESIMIFGFITTAFMDPTPNAIESSVKGILNEMASEIKAATTAKGAQLVIDLTKDELKAIKTVVEAYKVDDDPDCGEAKTSCLIRKLDVLLGE
jgi:hypothetical protein